MVDYYIPHSVFILFLYIISGLQASQSWICNKGQSILFSPCIQGIGTCNSYLSLFLGFRYFHVKLIWNGLQRIWVMIFRPWFWKWLYRCLPPTVYLRPECAKIYGHTWRHFGAISWPSEALWRHMTCGSLGVIMIPDGTAQVINKCIAPCRWLLFCMLVHENFVADYCEHNI